MLAPIALYPDQLLTQVLMASTYPLQIVEAHRWWTAASIPSNQADCRSCREACTKQRRE